MISYNNCLMDRTNELILKSMVESVLAEGRKSCLSELQQFRANPSVLIPHLQERVGRYRKHGDSDFLFSNIHKKKALELHEHEVRQNIQQLIQVLSSEEIKLQKLTIVPRLDEIATKLCQVIMPQMSTTIQFKPEFATLLRQILNQDAQYNYPNSVTCLVALTFDEPYESLMSLLIDDGLPKRPNRTALLNNKMRYAGVASMICLSQQQFRCTVYVMTDEIIAKQSSLPSATSIDNIQNKQAIRNDTNPQQSNQSQSHISQQGPNQSQDQNMGQYSGQYSGQSHNQSGYSQNWNVNPNNSNFMRPATFSNASQTGSQNQGSQSGATRINFSYNQANTSQPNHN